MIERRQADVVVPVDIRAEKFLSRAHPFVRNAQVFPVADAETINCLDDKCQFAQTIERHGIAGSTTRLMPSATDVHHLDLESPLLVKPLRQRYSRGLKKLASSSDLLEHIRSADSARGLPLIAQEFVPGDDLYCSVLACDGEVVAWTAQESGPLPGRCAFTRDPDCFEIACRVVRACRYSGVAHINMRRDRRSSRVLALEFSPGFWLPVHASKVWDVDFVGLGIDVALGVNCRRAPVRRRSGRPTLCIPGTSGQGSVAGTNVVEALQKSCAPGLETAQ